MTSFMPEMTSQLEIVEKEIPITKADKTCNLT